MNTQTTLTLSAINSQLARAGIPTVIDANTAARLKGLETRERLLTAIQAAPNDPRERQWLIRLLGRAGITVPDEKARPPAARPVSHDPASALPPKAAPPPGDPDGSAASEARDERHDAGNTAVRERLSVHVYGGKAALCFEADVTREGLHTAALDAAVATGPRRYDWSGKIRLQLTVRELPVVAAVMFGFAPSCEFTNHGKNNDKGFSFENQQKNDTGQVFARVFAKDQVLRAVPIDAMDAWRVGVLLVRQLRLQYPWLDGEALMMSLRSIGARIGQRRPRTAAGGES